MDMILMVDEYRKALDDIHQHPEAEDEIEEDIQMQSEEFPSSPTTASPIISVERRVKTAVPGERGALIPEIRSLEVLPPDPEPVSPMTPTRPSSSRSKDSSPGGVDKFV